MDTRNQELIELLHQQIELLRSHGVEGWASHLEDCRERCRRFDSMGLASIVRSFGGMGSLSDLQIDIQNGHRIKPEDEEHVNTQLHLLNSQICTLASELLAEANAL